MLAELLLQLGAALLDGGVALAGFAPCSSAPDSTKSRMACFNTCWRGALRVAPCAAMTALYLANNASLAPIAVLNSVTAGSIAL